VRNREACLASLFLLALSFFGFSYVRCAGEYTYYGYVPKRIWHSEEYGGVFTIEPLTVADSALLAVVACQDSTEVRVYTIPDKELVKEAKLDSMGKLFVEFPNGTFFKVEADKPVSVVLLGGNVGGKKMDPSLPGLDTQQIPNSFYTSVEGGFVGKDFIFMASQGLTDVAYRVVALEDSEVNVVDEEDSTVRTFELSANEFEELSLSSFKAYRMTSTGRMMVHTISLGSIPSVEGGYTGRRFFSACITSYSPSRSAAPYGFQISAMEDTMVTVYDVEFRRKIEELTVPGGKNVTVRPQAREIFIEADKPIAVIYINYEQSLWGRGLTFTALAAGEKAQVYVPVGPTVQESYIFTREETVVTIDMAPLNLPADSIFPLQDGLHEIMADKNILIQVTHWADQPLQAIRDFGAVIPAVETVNVREEVELEPIVTEESNMYNVLYVLLAAAAVAAVVSYVLKVRRKP
jgi:hypothetical protein